MNSQYHSVPLARASDCRRECATILVVEEHDCLRDVARAILERFGYRVQTAENGQIAKRMLRDDSRIDLVLADVEMGDLPGQELAGWSRMNRPDVEIVYTSGTPGRLRYVGPWTVEMPFIHIDTLVKTIREALENARVSRILDRTAA